jgi:hypothetical protein
VDARDERGHDGLNERVVQIIPFGVGAIDEAHLPGAGPVLDGCLTLNGGSDIVEPLCINQPLQAVVFGKSVDQPFPMFVGSSRQVAGDTDVKDAVAPIGHEINPATRHFRIKARRGWPEQVRP